MVIANRAAVGQGSALSMQVFLAAVAAPMLIVAALAGHASGIDALAITPIEGSVALRCAIVAISASLAHWLIFRGTMRAGAAMIAPMSYVQLPVAGLLGWVFFADSPDVLTLAGAAVIIGAGLLLWWMTPAAKPAEAEIRLT